MKNILKNKNEKPEQIKPDAIHFCNETLLARTSSEDVVGHLIRVALADFPKKLEKLNVSIQDGDIKSIRGLAHQLKGAALNLGYTLIAEIAATMEKMANIDENLPLLKDKFKELQAEWKIVKDILEK